LARSRGDRLSTGRSRLLYQFLRMSGHGGSIAQR
jgi:hypothetical protein